MIFGRSFHGRTFIKNKSQLCQKTRNPYLMTACCRTSFSVVLSDAYAKKALLFQGCLPNMTLKWMKFLILDN